MAQSLRPPLSVSWVLPACWDAVQPPSPSDTGCGCSPASSPNSWGSVPIGSPVPSPGRPGALAAPRAKRRGARSGRQGVGQRQSASEREKLRMRTLARALHELRRFLPPSVAPAGQSLTKIETLRLAIRYIGHLSAVLGLSEESLRRRRRSDAALPQGCPLCPDGGPAQAQARGPDLGSAAPAAGSWGSPPACPGAPAVPERLRSRVPDVGPWVSPPYCPGMQSLPQVTQGRAPDAALWTPTPAGSGTQTPPELGTQATSWAMPPADPEPSARYQGIPVSPEPYLLPETPPLLPRLACQRLQPQAQWGYWSHSAEVLPSSEYQGPGPAFQFSDETPLQSSGLQLSGCPELWQEDLEGGRLSIFY